MKTKKSNITVTADHIIILDLKVPKNLIKNKSSDIARISRLHPSTVGRILNNKGTKKITSLQKVRDALYELFINNGIEILHDPCIPKSDKVLHIDTNISKYMRSLKNNGKTFAD